MPSWIRQAFSDWLTLLGGPDPSLFNADLGTSWKRLFSLLALVVFLAGVGYGVPLVASPSTLLKTIPSLIVFNSRPALLFLLGAAALAGIYTYVFAKIFVVPITIKQAFFIILFLGLPWVPITAFMLGLETVGVPFYSLIFLLWIYFVLIILIVNFYRGISSMCVTCPRWRVFGSVFIAIMLVVFSYFALMEWLVRVHDEPTPTSNVSARLTQTDPHTLEFSWPQYGHAIAQDHVTNR